MALSLDVRGYDGSVTEEQAHWLTKAGNKTSERGREECDGYQLAHKGQ